MAETGLVLNEFQQIMEHIAKGENFLLSGGAGSGKTYSLVEVIRKVIEDNPTSKVACMTYTNAAVKQIEERVNHSNLNVTTIHDFLWDNIKHFQKELKIAIVNLNNDVDNTKIDFDDELISETFFDHLEKGIQYKEYLRLREGIISHDELLVIANYMFANHTKLCDILKDKYKFIFIDEYQDTHKEVVELLLVHLQQSKKKNVIGFFGDAMQSIYDEGVGNLDIYKNSNNGKVKEVKKEVNRRNPKLIYELANRLRTDGIIQTHSLETAPNIINGEVKNGSIKFIHSSVANVEGARIYLTGLGWNFNDSKETKELNLTHNLIADKAGFRSLMDIYDKDPIIGLKTDILTKIKDNKKNNRPEIHIAEEDTFDMVVDKFQLKNRQRELKKDIILREVDKKILYDQLKDLKFSEVRKVYLNKDSLVDDKKQDEDDENKKGSKRDNLIKHLFKIQNNIYHYQSKNYNAFLRATDYKIHITSIKQKQILKDNIENLIKVEDKTIEEIILEANEKRICFIDQRLEKFILNNEYLYNRVKQVKYKEFQELYQYLEGSTPFSTQHKTKGAEFNNVLVILDNGDWNKYNFEYLFTDSGTDSVRERTQKIFYVCCTRARENLAVYYHDPAPIVILKAKEWFGEANVISLE